MGRSLGVVVCAERAEPEVGGVWDCDQALALLRVQARSGSCEERELARLAIDDVLDRRNRLLMEQGRMGAQS